MVKFKNILIARTDRIGDVVLTTPVIKALRKAYPMARISMIVTPVTKELVEGNPYLDEVLIDDRRNIHKGFFGGLRLLWEVRCKDFDCIFIFHTKKRNMLASFLLGIPVRIGYKSDKFGFLLTHPLKDVRHLGHKHEAQYCLDVLKKVGIEDSQADFFIPTNKEAEEWANQWLASNHISSGEVIAIHAGSSDAAKCWASDKFAELINSLNVRYQFKLVLIGSPDTYVRSQEIIQLCKVKPLDLTGKTTLTQTISLLRRCRLLVSNDSGPVHIGAAIGIDVLSLFMRNDPGLNPERWKPLSEKSNYLFSPQGLKVEEVLDAIEQIFSKSHQKFFNW
jgi:heptosyltransferase II